MFLYHVTRKILLQQLFWRVEILRGEKGEIIIILSPLLILKYSLQLLTLECDNNIYLAFISITFNYRDRQSAGSKFYLISGPNK